MGGKCLGFKLWGCLNPGFDFLFCSRQTFIVPMTTFPSTIKQQGVKPWLGSLCCYLVTECKAEFLEGEKFIALPVWILNKPNICLWMAWFFPPGESLHLMLLSMLKNIWLILVCTAMWHYPLCDMSMLFFWVERYFHFIGLKVCAVLPSQWQWSGQKVLWT